ncbi:MAG: restriction endonuclease [Erythrobacter sp.]|nr:restriction endonuclease [Erythrobacter sp.]
MTHGHWRHRLKKVSKIRDFRVRQQKETCFYCCQPIWCENHSDFASRFGITEQSAKRLQATAEHLLARSEGGTDALDNVVAACWFCNTQRHRSKRPLSPEAYIKKVRSRLDKGRWHGFIAEK